MDVEVVETEVRGGGVGDDAVVGIVIERVAGVAVLRRRGLVALGVVGELEAGDVDVLRAGELEDGAETVAAEELRLARAAGEVLAEQLGRLARGASGDGRHLAAVGIARALRPAVAAVRPLVSHAERAALEDDAVAAGDLPLRSLAVHHVVAPEIIGIGERAVLWWAGVFAGEGRVGLAVALSGGATVEAHVPDSAGGGSDDARRDRSGVVFGSAAIAGSAAVGTGCVAAVGVRRRRRGSAAIGVRGAGVLGAGILRRAAVRGAVVVRARTGGDDQGEEDRGDAERSGTESGRASFVIDFSKERARAFAFAETENSPGAGSFRSHHRPERTRTIWPLRTDWAHVLRGAISARTRCGRRRMGWASHRGRACLRRRRSRGASAGIRAGSPPRRDLGNRPPNMNPIDPPGAGTGGAAIRRRDARPGDQVLDGVRVRRARHRRLRAHQRTEIFAASPLPSPCGGRAGRIGHHDDLERTRIGAAAVCAGEHGVSLEGRSRARRRTRADRSRWAR